MTRFSRLNDKISNIKLHNTYKNIRHLVLNKA